MGCPVFSFLLYRTDAASQGAVELPTAIPLSLSTGRCLISWDGVTLDTALLSTGRLDYSARTSTNSALMSTGRLIIRLARARTGMLPRVQLPTDSCRLLLQVSYGCLWLPTVAYRSSNSCTDVGWHLTPRVYYKLNLGNVPLESSSGWSTRLTTSTALMFFFFFMIQVWKEL